MNTHTYERGYHIPTTGPATRRRLVRFAALAVIAVVAGLGICALAAWAVIPITGRW